MTTRPATTHDEAELRTRADGGDVWAMSMLGHQLYQRRVTHAEALQWWRRAAQLGDAYSMQRLGAARQVDQEERERWAALGSATARGKGTQPVPAQVAATAERAGLGEYQAIFGPRYGVRDPRTGPTVWVFERGFVSQEPKAGELTTFAWGRCRIRRGALRHVRNGTYSYTGYELWVTRDDGATFHLQGTSGMSGEVWVLGELIMKEINKVRLGHAINGLQRGRKLDFGPLSIDAYRIYDGSDGLFWREVEDIGIHQGRLVIRRMARLFAWSKTDTCEIPDFEVFFALAQALHKSAHGE
jgi:hypothetical protein